ncbi:arylamine N-acetyltransferase [Legionella sp. km772]|uniref:arylamine N-acetyltransferase n=1 Tax=Legionella sp. km772 TaxID=2498111 RepID=UPI000F8C53C8|nr:arylamine N-acetyltransferase [Legionella sp. km772]RUR08650.1 N-hydroxyarylamine O-acetyltransferase [Legionella sp. km772]
MKEVKLVDYFAKIKLDFSAFQDLLASDKTEALKQVYFAHIKAFPYSNFEIREAAHQHPVQRNALTFFNHARIMNQGGYCFQTNALLYSALTQLGFKPIFCAARGLVGKPVNDASVLRLPTTHVVLVVPIGGQQYFLEPAMGMQAPRYPILIQDSKDPIIQDRDEFLFYKQHDVYVLAKKMRGNWFNLMQSTLVETSEKVLHKNLLGLERFPNPVAIRDEKTLVAVVTDKGSKALYWDMSSTQLKFMRQEDDVFTQEVIGDWKLACDLLESEFSIKGISEAQIKKYCSPLSIPKPKRRWEIDFPITVKDLERMEENLTYSP